MGVELYGEEHRIFRDSFRRFLQKEVVPNYDEYEQAGMYPREIWKRMGEQGYLCPWVDEKYGGGGVGFEYSMIIEEELGLNGIDIAAMLHSDIVAPYIYSFGSEEQKMKWLPPACTGDLLLAVGMTEPNTGSDLAAIKTTAIKDGNDYIINGQKVFITNGISADLVIMACKTDPKANPPHRGVSLIAVETDRPGFSKGMLKKMGLRSQDTAELFLEDVRVPQSNLIGEEGQGFKYLMLKLQQERIVQTMGGLFTAHRIFNDTVEYTKTRVAFGQPIIQFQANTFKVVEMATELELGTNFIYTMINAHIEGKNVVKQVSMAKWWITEMVQRVAYHCLQLHGGYGFMEEYPVSRAYRDVRMQTIAAGTTEIMKRIIAKEMGL
ncbi:MAG: acyl-CoA dehydrogenase family protein [Bacillota bacterium]